jgi:hypothetical protein
MLGWWKAVGEMPISLLSVLIGTSRHDAPRQRRRVSLPTTVRYGHLSPYHLHRNMSAGDIMITLCLIRRNGWSWNMRLFSSLP